MLDHEVSRDAGLASPLQPAGSPLPAPTAERRLTTQGVPVELPLALDLRLSVGGDGPEGSVTSRQVSPSGSAERGIRLPPPAALLLAAAAATAASAALAYGGQALKSGAIRFFVPLYARISRSEVFENEVRERIFTFVKAEPGISASELAGKAGVSWGTTIYHLDVLQQNRMIVSARDGRYRRYFENGAPARDRRGVISVLRNPVSAHVARTAADRPGLAQKELATAAGLSPQALHWHARRLVAAGVLRKEREGRIVRYYGCAGEPTAAPTS